MPWAIGCRCIQLLQQFGYRANFIRLAIDLLPLPQHQTVLLCPDAYHGSATEVVRTGLRLLENEEQKLETPRKLIAEGKASGEAEYSYEKFIAELDEEFG